MKQETYEAILKCISFGAPAMAERLIGEFNNMIALANERIVEKQREAKAAEIKAAEEKDTCERTKKG